MGVGYPRQHTLLEVGVERVVAQAQQPVGREYEQAPFALNGHLSEKENVVVIGRALAVERIVQRDGQRHMG